MIARSIGMVLVALMLVSGLSAGAEKKKNEKDQLQGEWTVVSMELSGRKRPAGLLKRLKPLRVKGSMWTAPGGRKFTFTIDSTKSPKELDLKFNKAGKVQTWRGIYKLEGNTLTFCRSLGADGPRPTEFKGGKGVAILVFKQVGK